MQLSEENVAICVSFAPLKTSNSNGYFSGYTIFYHDKYRNTNTKLMKIKISKRATHARNELLLLQNVSARVWQNLVTFSSVVIHQEFFNRGSCMRPAAAVLGLHRAAGHGRCGV